MLTYFINNNTQKKKERNKKSFYFQFIQWKSKEKTKISNLPIDAEKPPENALDGSNGFIKSLIPKWLPIGKQPPPIPFFFFDFDDNLRFRVWIPSFFIVNGRLTYRNQNQNQN